MRFALRLLATAAMLAGLAVSAMAQAVSHTTAQSAPHGTPVAAHALARGVVLVAGDIAYSDSLKPVMASAVAAGWSTRRVIAAGEALVPPSVQPPQLVTPNEPVEVEWSEGNVRLTLRGTALRGGAEGERVYVRTDSGHRIDGVVIGEGRVRIQ